MTKEIKEKENEGKLILIGEPEGPGHRQSARDEREDQKGEPEPESPDPVESKSKSVKSPPGQVGVAVQRRAEIACKAVDAQFHRLRMRSSTVRPRPSAGSKRNGRATMDPRASGCLAT